MGRRQGIAKHEVSFEEAALALGDPQSIDFDDGAQPENLVTLAWSPEGRILYIVTTEREPRLRIISARRATSHERRSYQEGD